MFFFFCALCYAFVFFHRNAPAVLSSYLAKAYDVETTKLSLFSSIFFWPYAILQPFGGILADIMEPAILLCLSSVIASVGSVICGASNSLDLSLFARFLVGIGCAPCFVPVSRIMANWFPPKLYPFANGAILAVGGAGGIVSQEPLRLFADKYGYRWSFYGIAILSNVIAGLTIFFVRGDPREFGYQEVNHIEDKDAKTLKEHFIELKDHLVEVLKKRSIYLHSYFCLIQNGTYFCVASFWGGPYIEAVFPNENKGTLLTALSVGMIIGSLCLPEIPKLFNSRKFTLIGCSITGALCSAVFIIWDVDLGFGGMYFFFILWGSVTGGASGLIFSYTKELYSLEVAGTSVGLANAFPHFGAAILQSIVDAILHSHDKTGEHYSRDAFRNSLWILSCVCNACSLFGPLFCREVKPNSPPKSHSSLDDNPSQSNNSSSINHRKSIALNANHPLDDNIESLPKPPTKKPSPPTKISESSNKSSISDSSDKSSSTQTNTIDPPSTQTSTLLTQTTKMTSSPLGSSVDSSLSSELE